VDILVCGAQVPSMHGGAEMAQADLAAALIAAGHQVEQIRLPAAFDRERAFDSALAWRLVPLDADLVIATNFPSYFARHPRKVVWLFHQHRSFYDAVDAPWSDLGHDDESLELRRLMTEWDTRALSEAVRRFTYSGVVAARLRRYNGLDAEALYLPPPLHGRFRSGEFGDYLFCPTRFERNKRPELMVRAMAHVRADVRLVLAGRGTLETEMKALVDELSLADRVELRGYVDDDELIDLYANALGVVYVPHDEDYGLVTLQAFEAARPVVTAADAGGVLEWAEDGVTGLVAEGSPEALGAAIERLAGDRDLAQRLGANGQQKVASLGWDVVVARLTQV